MQSTKGPLLLSFKWAPGLYLLFLCVCALWLGSRLPYHNDLLVYVTPERAFNLESLRAGLIPLWDPYLSCGIPHLANWQSAFFYPPYWLLNVLGLPGGLFWLALLHEAWAFAGFFFWARSQKCGGWAAALCALSFAGSAHFIRCWINLPFIATASWIPWVFLSAGRALQNRRLKDHLLAVGVLSLQLLAGYPTFVFYTWLVLFLWLAFSYPLPFLGRGFLLVAAALFLTSLQWLPFLEFLTYAFHDRWKVFPYYTHPWEYLTLLHPTILGVPGFTGYKSDATNSLFGNLYFGLLPCLIWIASLIFKRNRSGSWGPLSLLLLAWMAGPSLFLWKIIPSNGFNHLEPSKAVGLFLFAACTSLCRWMGDPGDSNAGNPCKSPWIWILAGLWVLDLALLPFRLTYRVPDPFHDNSLQQQVEDIRRASKDGRFLGLQTSAEMSVEGGQINDEMVGRLSQVFVNNLLPNTNMVWGLRTVTGYFSLQTTGFRDMMLYLNRGFPYPGGLLEVAGVRAYLFPQPLPGLQFRLVEKVGGNFLSEDPQASPDLRWVNGAVMFPDRPSILDVLSQKGVEWRKKVYLEGNNGDFLHLPPSAHSIVVTPAKAYSRPSSGRVLEETHSTSPGYLVFNDSYAPGWHAWVDGSPTSILRAYGLFMAVKMEAGDHRVEFRYEPASFRLGLFLSLLSLAVFSVGLLKILKPNKKLISHR